MVCFLLVTIVFAVTSFLEGMHSSEHGECMHQVAVVDGSFTAHAYHMTPNIYSISTLYAMVFPTAHFFYQVKWETGLSG